MHPLKKTVNFFDKLEDFIREHLSRYPIVYTFIGSIAIVLFWRGIWQVADKLEAGGGWIGWLFYGPVNLIIVVLILLATGLFVSYFIGDTILISGLKKEKKITEKTARDVKGDEIKIGGLEQNVTEMKEEVDEMRNYMSEIGKRHWEQEVKGGDKRD